MNKYLSCPLMREVAKSQTTVSIYGDVISESFPAEDLEECSQKFVTIY